MTKISMLDRLSLSQKSRAGTSAQKNFSVAGDVSTNYILKKLEFSKVVANQADTGILLNVIFSAYGSQDLTTAEPFYLFLYTEAEMYENFEDGDPFVLNDTIAFSNPPFKIVRFDYENAIDGLEFGASLGGGTTTKIIESKVFTPTVFKCEEGKNSIYGFLVAKSDFTGLGEKWCIELSIAY